MVNCSKGSEGVLCGLCTEGYVKASTGHCIVCSDPDYDGLVSRGWLLVIILIAAIATVAFIYNYYSHHRDYLRTIINALSSKLKVTAGKLLSRSYHLGCMMFVCDLGFFQIVLLIGGIYQVDWPWDFLR